MVDNTEVYKTLVQQAAAVFESLRDLYLPDVKAKKDWADYQEFPTENSEKRAHVTRLHAELEEIIKAVAPINNSLEQIK